MLQYADPAHEKGKYFIGLKFLLGKQSSFPTNRNACSLDISPGDETYLKSSEWVDGIWQWDKLCLARTCPPWGKPPWLPVSHQPFLCPNSSVHPSQRWHICFRYNHAQWTKQTVIATTSFYMYVQELMQYVYKALPVYMNKYYTKLSWR